MLSEQKISKYFALAKNMAEMSDFHKQHLGSVLVYKNKIISVGYNCQKTSPLQAEYNKYREFEHNPKGIKDSLHSEILCLSKAKYLDIEWSKASLFTYRIKCDGSQGLAKYCNACGEYIRHLGVGNIYYTTNAPNCFVYEKIC